LGGQRPHTEKEKKKRVKKIPPSHGDGFSRWERQKAGQSGAAEEVGRGKEKQEALKKKTNRRGKTKYNVT